LPSARFNSHWDEAVWQSTGFERARPRAVHLDGSAAEVGVACLPLYRRLHAGRWDLG